jgi:hypothetical protein
MSIKETLKSFFLGITRLFCVVMIFGSGVIWTLAVQRYPEILAADNIQSLITILVILLLMVFGVWIRRAQLFWKIALIVLTLSIMWAFVWVNYPGALMMLFVLSFFTLLFAGLVMWDEICDTLHKLFDIQETFLANRRHRRERRTRKSNPSQPKSKTFTLFGS